MNPIDLRSDTVTTRTEAMREAMKTALVGDDVFREDPTVIELENRSAQITGKEKGLFVSSGTMGNLVALLSHCGRGDQILVARGAHIFQYEQGGASTLGGITMNPLGESKFRHLEAADVKKNIAQDDVHKPLTRLLSLENTMNGIPQPVEDIEAICQIARQNNLLVHLDGARIFNAACALEVEPGEIVAQVDSVQFCFSKGLSAPVGSMLCGNEKFIEKARRWRKAVGGGMRQAGVIAASCLIALEKMRDRLLEDHKTARALGEGLQSLEFVHCDLKNCHTNMVFLEVSIPGKTACDLEKKLKEKNLLVLALSDTMIRAVTHYGITDSDIDLAIEIFKNTVLEMAGEKTLVSGK